jgi:hypothetical protein
MALRIMSSLRGFMTQTRTAIFRTSHPPMSISLSHSPEVLDQLDVVELAVDSGRWESGTIGTVVEVSDHGALVEIDDDRGHTLEFVSLPFSALRRVPLSAQEHLAV